MLVLNIEAFMADSSDCNLISKDEENDMYDPMEKEFVAKCMIELRAAISIFLIFEGGGKI